MQEISRCKPVKNRAEEHTGRAAVQTAAGNTVLGQARVSDELCKKGVLIPRGEVRSVWLRRGMETFRKSLKALPVKA